MTHRAGLLVAAAAAALLAPSPGAAHIIVYKTCLSETIEAVSAPRILFERRHEARKSGTYSWNARASDEYGGLYADFTLSNDTRALCQRAESGGFQCVLSGIPCREVEDCEAAGSRYCYEVER